MDNWHSGNQDETEQPLVTLYIPLLATAAVGLPLLFIATRSLPMLPFFILFLGLSAWYLWLAISGAERSLVLISLISSVVLSFIMIFCGMRYNSTLAEHGGRLLAVSLAALLPMVIVQEMARPQLMRMHGDPVEPGTVLPSSSNVLVLLVLILSTIVYIGGSLSGDGKTVDLFVVALFAIPSYFCIFALLSLGKMLRLLCIQPSQHLTLSGDFLQNWMRILLIVLLVGIALATLMPKRNPFRNLFKNTPTVESPFKPRQDSENARSPFSSSQGSGQAWQNGPHGTGRGTPDPRNRSGRGWGNQRGNGSNAGGSSGGDEYGNGSNPGGGSGGDESGNGSDSGGDSGSGQGSGDNGQGSGGDGASGGESSDGSGASSSGSGLMSKAVDGLRAISRLGEKPSTAEPQKKAANAKENLEQLKEEIRQHPWRLVKLILIAVLLIAAIIAGIILWRRWRRKVEEEQARRANRPKRNPFLDPFTTEPDASPEALVKMSYDTFLAYLWIAGYQRKPQQTEFDYALWLEGNSPVKNDAVWTITRHGTRAFYANASFTGEELDALHSALQTIMQQATAKLTPEKLQEKQEEFLGGGGT